MIDRGRLDTDYLYGRFFLFQVFADACQGSTYTKAGEEVINLSGGLLPYLRAGVFVMSLNVQLVFILIRIYIFFPALAP